MYRVFHSFPTFLDLLNSQSPEIFRAKTNILVIHITVASSWSKFPAIVARFDGLYGVEDQTGKSLCFYSWVQSNWRFNHPCVAIV